MGYLSAPAGFGSVSEGERERDGCERFVDARLRYLCIINFHVGDFSSFRRRRQQRRRRQHANVSHQVRALMGDIVRIKVGCENPRRASCLCPHAICGAYIGMHDAEKLFRTQHTHATYHTHHTKSDVHKSWLCRMCEAVLRRGLDLHARMNMSLDWTIYRRRWLCCLRLDRVSATVETAKRPTTTTTSTHRCAYRCGVHKIIYLLCERTQTYTLPTCSASTAYGSCTYTHMFTHNTDTVPRHCAIC